MLSFNTDEAVSALRASDAQMADLITRVGPFELVLTDEWSPFQALVRSVIFQQISTHAGRAIQGRLFSLYDDSAPEPDAVLQTTPEELRAVGLSQAKEKTIRNLAVHAADGTLPDRAAMEKLTDEEIIETLTLHRGIGIWTAQMLLIFNLGRPDVWPVTDLGIRRGYKIAYDLDELPMPSELRASGDRWKPFRSIASWYLWRANDL